MEEQRGIAIHMFAGEQIENVLDEYGVGKAVVYGPDEREVLEGQEALVNDFAGVVNFVGPEAIMNRTPKQHVNQGTMTVEEGDIVGVLNDHVMPVRVSGTVDNKAFLTLDNDGLFQQLNLSATPSATEVMQICGRALQGRNNAGTITAMIWVRK